MWNPIQYSVVVPVYNEEPVLRETYRRLTEVMRRTGERYELLFVNDGSRDRSAAILGELCAGDPAVKAIHFSRNFGHQIAITAGMDHAAGHAVVVIDADLQDPPELIEAMIGKWKEGYDVVYAKRTERKGETRFKRWSAHLFYRTLRALTDVDIPADTGDFRLIDRKVCDAMKTIREKNRFIRGLVSWLGFKQTSVEYSRDERWAGETKYPLGKMLKLSADALTSFSHKPLKLATYIGFALSGGSFLALLITVYLKLFMASTIAGWASIICLSLLFNGVILLILGIIGEYIGRIYDESKDRPLYLIGAREGFAKERLPVREAMGTPGGQREGLPAFDADSGQDRGWSHA
ncbi:glycosyltransferase family 2 protein [Paenibacillus filicis]|uniref:Glycosyltransferase family 2 protein n=1 Tax=Paenibacillus gyeongsangnamensis TaxID=3388067 RepID=A0ABT4Q8T1_9BACL|nr:glycosyltransferase family 2 protein [Paenibacillus filicis]MCZ8513294.1 glycosyltransferase family 2 protein [Paenibacillus filicis]